MLSNGNENAKLDSWIKIAHNDILYVSKFSFLMERMIDLWVSTLVRMVFAARPM